MALVSVIIPTFDHQDTLRTAIASVQQQTLSDFEVFVLGDGAPARTAEILAEISAADSRIHYLPQAKDKRHGEVYRDRLIRQLTSPYITYLADDDLWLPQHLETLVAALQHAAFVQTLFLDVAVDGVPYNLLHNLNSPLLRPQMQARVLTGGGYGLSATGHSRQAYLDLPEGWTTTPVGYYTDIYMWAKFACAGVAAASVLRPTAVHLGAPERQADPPAQRIAELQTWLHRLRQPDVQQQLAEEIFYSPYLLLEHVNLSSLTGLDDLLAQHQIQLVEGDRLPDLTSLTANDMSLANLWLTASQREALELQVLSRLGRVSPEARVERWRHLVDQCPSQGRWRLELGRSLAQSGDWQGAEEVMRSTQPAEQRMIGAVCLHAEAIAHLGQPQAAEALLHQRAQRSPLHVEIIASQAEIKILAEHWDDAIALLEASIQHDKKLKVPLLHRLAELHRRRPDLPSMIQAYERIVALNPNDPRALLGLGFDYYAQQRNEDALEMLGRALQFNPYSINAYLHQCWAAGRLGQWFQVQAAAVAGLALAPEHPILSTQLGIALLRLGEVAEAIAAFDIALQHDAPPLSAYIGRAQAAERLQHWPHVTAVATAGLANFPQNVTLLTLQATGQFNQQHYDAALQVLHRAIALDPTRPYLYRLICNAFLKLDLEDQAKIIAQRGLFYSPHDPHLRQIVNAGIEILDV
ncbi:MAG: glycosyltransferase [Kaiparowitsia implicata GSE-PSE-MK54-09C]|jgi:tetratricopeptide (TPR) repeat protein|nr:glycosyltransferase [Kaiparowitsia implicata GSE-PSE-MK54-09C]